MNGNQIQMKKLNLKEHRELLHSTNQTRLRIYLKIRNREIYLKVPKRSLKNLRSQSKKIN